MEYISYSRAQVPPSCCAQRFYHWWILFPAKEEKIMMPVR